MSAGSASASVSSTTPNGTPLPAGPPPPRPVNEAPETSLLREASQRVATKLADALSAEGVYVNRIKVEFAGPLPGHHSLERPDGPPG